MKMLILLISFLVAGCAQMTNEDGQVDGKSWDFDHQVQFDQHKVGDNKYFIRVRSTSRTHFGMLATFLVRQSFDICKSYGYKIEILDGVESYNDEKYIESYIPSSLEANIECPIVKS